MLFSFHPFIPLPSLNAWALPELQQEKELW